MIIQVSRKKGWRNSYRGVALLKDKDSNIRRRCSYKIKLNFLQQPKWQFEIKGFSGLIIKMSAYPIVTESNLEPDVLTNRYLCATIISAIAAAVSRNTNPLSINIELLGVIVAANKINKNCYEYEIDLDMMGKDTAKKFRQSFVDNNFRITKKMQTMRF